MPRPTRRFACLAPSAGLMVVQFHYQLLESWSAAQPTTLTRYETLLIMPRTAGVSCSSLTRVESAQAQAAHRGAVRFAGADQALDELDLDGLCIRHGVLTLSPEYLRPSCRAWPRFGRRGLLRRPSSVARTRLYGFVEPWHLATMFGHAHHVEHRAHRAAGDDAGAVRRRRHEHLRCAVLADAPRAAACRSSAAP